MSLRTKRSESVANPKSSKQETGGQTRQSKKSSTQINNKQIASCLAMTETNSSQIKFYATTSHLARYCERNAVRVWQPQTRVSKQTHPNKAKQKIKHTNKQQTDCFVPRNDVNKQQANKFSHHTKPSSMSLRTKRSERVATPNKSKQAKASKANQKRKQALHRHAKFKNKTVS